MDNQTLIKLVPTTISLIFTSAFGLFVGVLLERFRNRVRTITYDIRTQKVKPPLSGNLGDQLKITLSNRIVNTLKVVTIEIENKSSIDLDNIVTNFTVGRGAIFQGDEGYLLSNYTPLYWSSQYNSNFQGVLKDYNQLPVDPSNQNLRLVPDDFQPRIDFLTSNKEYLIPVFNRKEKAIFNFLIEDPIDGSDAEIFPSIVHKSVNFTKKIDDTLQKQKDLWKGVFIGIVFVAIVIGFLSYFNPCSIQLIIWSAIIGLSYSIVGYMMLYFYKKLREFFK